MTKHKVTVTLDPSVIALTDADASAEHQTRSSYVERVLRAEHYRRMMARGPVQPEPGPAETAQMRALMAWQRTDDVDLPFVSGAEA